MLISGQARYDPERDLRSSLCVPDIQPHVGVSRKEVNQRGGSKYPSMMVRGPRVIVGGAIGTHHSCI